MASKTDLQEISVNLCQNILEPKAKIKKGYCVSYLVDVLRVQTVQLSENEDEDYIPLLLGFNITSSNRHTTYHGMKIILVKDF